MEPFDCQRLNPLSKPYQRNLYWTKNLADDKTSEEVCITCKLDDEIKDEVTGMSSCWWKDFIIQRTGDGDETYVFFVNCRGPGIPKTLVTKIEIKDDAVEMANHLNTLRIVFIGFMLLTTVGDKTAVIIFDVKNFIKTI